jgi:uncharacterized membrane protein (UPF0127 family)
LSDVIYIKGNAFNTLVAITESEQSRGLMYQNWPPPVMTFPYRTAAIRKFWMHNTVSPLDIVFCNANKIVAIYKGEPLSTTMVGPEMPVDLVVEFPAGTIKEKNISIGDEVSFKPAQNTVARYLKTYS